MSLILANANNKTTSRGLVQLPVTGTHMSLILQNVIAFLLYAYIIFSHNILTLRVRYFRRECTVAPCGKTRR